MTIKPDLPQIADREGIIFVCPDGKNSWYWDSPRNKDYRYESFVAKELVEYIDKNFATKADRSGRVITGLSMGGHGGMWLSIRHQDIFGGGGSMSGGLDIRPFPDSWNMKARLGEYASNKEVWDNHTVINQIDNGMIIPYFLVRFIFSQLLGHVPVLRERANIHPSACTSTGTKRIFMTDCIPHRSVSTHT